MQYVIWFYQSIFAAAWKAINTPHILLSFMDIGSIAIFVIVLTVHVAIPFSIYEWIRNKWRWRQQEKVYARQEQEQKQREALREAFHREYDKNNPPKKEEIRQERDENGKLWYIASRKD